MFETEKKRQTKYLEMLKFIAAVHFFSEFFLTKHIEFQIFLNMVYF